MIVPKLRSPIVLVPGLLGYDELRLAGWRLTSYFSGIPERLREGGNRVLVARVSPTCGVDRRAAQLKAFLDQQSPGEPVHLFAHSMGGLDSRYLISRLGMADRVLTLTSIGTPHRGSAFADWAVKRLECVVKPVFDFINLPDQAFYDLTTERCRAFNDEVPDAPNVRYFSIAGRHDLNAWSPEWLIPHRIVVEKEGPNDGLVSVASATHGESVDVWEGDHLSLANCGKLVRLVRGLWFDRSSHYVDLLRRLADMGY
jgi:triacylglycerol lipase